MNNRDGLLVRRSLLEDAGCSVLLARNGEEGLKLFSESQVDVVVTDYRMTGMTGTELIRGIRNINPNARVILISAFVEHLGLTEANTGADVVIAKNATEPVQLVRSVKRLTNRPIPRKPAKSKKTLAGVARAAGA
jgi:two-component system response regulator AtoC